MLWALPFVLVTVIAFPAIAVINARHSRNTSIESVTPTALYLQLLLIQAVLAGLAALAQRGADVPIGWSARVAPDTVVPAIGLLGVAVILAVWFREPAGSAPEISHLLAPKSGRDWALWTAAMVAAAVAEEFAYRGTLFALASRVIDRPSISSLLTSAVFGLTHAAQGWRGVVMSGLFGLGLQSLVLWSGGLLLAILVHLTYDIGIQLAARWLIPARPASREPPARVA
jgi:membrane protease YdiL (CAAX protease family)